MKVGDKVDVTVAGHAVAHAEIKEINGDRAVLIVPATRVEFGIESRLSDLPVDVNDSGQGTQVIVDDAARVAQEAPAVTPDAAQPPAGGAVAQTTTENPDAQGQAQAKPPVETSTTEASTIDNAQTVVVESTPAEVGTNG